MFLPDQSLRDHLTTPTLVEIDYRAACFCHHSLVETGFVCSVCLSSKYSTPYCTDLKRILILDSGISAIVLCILDIHVSIVVTTEIFFVLQFSVNQFHSVPLVSKLDRFYCISCFHYNYCYYYCYDIVFDSSYRTHFNLPSLALLGKPKKKKNNKLKSNGFPKSSSK